MPVFFMKEVVGQIFEFLGRVGGEAGSLFDPFAEGSGVLAFFGFDQDEGEKFALPGRKGGGPAIGGVDDGLGLKGAGHPADADDDGAVVIDFQGIAHLERRGLSAGLLRLPGQTGVGSHVIHDNGVLLAQVVQAALEHDRRAADKRGVVQAEDIADLKVAVLQAGFQQAFVQGNSPFDAVDAPDAEEFGVLEGLDVVNELNLGIHHPDIRLGKVGNETIRPGHEAGEDRGLLGDEQGSEGQPHDDP